MNNKYKIRIVGNQIIEDNILKGRDGDIPTLLNINEGVKTVLGEKTSKDIKEHNYGDDIFYNAYNQNDVLRAVTMPDSVIKVGEKAFEHAHKLKEVYFSNSLEEIGLSAFLCCYALKEIYLPKSVNLLDTWCFSLIKDLVIHYEGILNEFSLIKKGDEWCNKGTRVICSDGELIVKEVRED